MATGLVLFGLRGRHSFPKSFFVLSGREPWLFFRPKGRGAMDDKPEGRKRRMRSQSRSNLLKAEMEEIRERTEDALKRSRAIIAKSKMNPGRGPIQDEGGADI